MINVKDIQAEERHNEFINIEHISKIYGEKIIFV